MNSTASATIATLGGQTMGTSWSVKLVAGLRHDLHALHNGIQARLDQVVAQMSTWEADSDISRFNRAKAGTVQPLPAQFFEVLSCALRIAAESDGAYDPTVAPLVALWGFGADAATRRIPDADTLATALARTGWRHIVLSAEDCSVVQPGGMRLDLSAIAKGYGVNEVVRHLQQIGISSALVEVGGELSGYGRKPDGHPWRVLVEAAPDEDDGISEPRVLTLDGIAVATSGDRWHAFQIDGERYAHTLDPRTGKPVAHAAAAVTVLASDAMNADAWATALTVMGADSGMEFAEIHALAARFVIRDGETAVERMSSAFLRHLHA